jgi:hypothetical protein
MTAWALVHTLLSIETTVADTTDRAVPGASADVLDPEGGCLSPGFELAGAAVRIHDAAVSSAPGDFETDRHGERRDTGLMNVDGKGPLLIPGISFLPMMRICSSVSRTCYRMTGLRESALLSTVVAECCYLRVDPSV